MEEYEEDKEYEDYPCRTQGETDSLFQILLDPKQSQVEHWDAACDIGLELLNNCQNIPDDKMLEAMRHDFLIKFRKKFDDAFLKVSGECAGIPNAILSFYEDLFTHNTELDHGRLSAIAEIIFNELQCQHTSFTGEIISSALKYLLQPELNFNSRGIIVKLVKLYIDSKTYIDEKFINEIDGNFQESGNSDLVKNIYFEILQTLAAKGKLSEAGLLFAAGSLQEKSLIEAATKLLLHEKIPITKFTGRVVAEIGHQFILASTTKWHIFDVLEALDKGGRDIDDAIPVLEAEIGKIFARDSKNQFFSLASGKQFTESGRSRAVLELLHRKMDAGYSASAGLLPYLVHQLEQGSQEQKIRVSRCIGSLLYDLCEAGDLPSELTNKKLISQKSLQILWQIANGFIPGNKKNGLLGLAGALRYLGKTLTKQEMQMFSLQLALPEMLQVLTAHSMAGGQLEGEFFNKIVAINDRIAATTDFVDLIIQQTSLHKELHSSFQLKKKSLDLLAGLLINGFVEYGEEVSKNYRTKCTEILIQYKDQLTGNSKNIFAQEELLDSGLSISVYLTALAGLSREAKLISWNNLLNFKELLANAGSSELEQLYSLVNQAILAEQLPDTVPYSKKLIKQILKNFNMRGIQQDISYFTQLLSTLIGYGEYHLQIHKIITSLPGKLEILQSESSMINIINVAKTLLSSHERSFSYDEGFILWLQNKMFELEDVNGSVAEAFTHFLYQFIDQGGEGSAFSEQAIEKIFAKESVFFVQRLVLGLYKNLSINGNISAATIGIFSKFLAAETREMVFQKQYQIKHAKDFLEILGNMKLSGENFKEVDLYRLALSYKHAQTISEKIIFCEKIEQIVIVSKEGQAPWFTKNIDIFVEIFREALAYRDRDLSQIAISGLAKLALLDDAKAIEFISTNLSYIIQIKNKYTDGKDPSISANSIEIYQKLSLILPFSFITEEMVNEFKIKVQDAFGIKDGDSSSLQQVLASFFASGRFTDFLSLEEFFETIKIYAVNPNGFGIFMAKYHDMIGARLQISLELEVFRTSLQYDNDHHSIGLHGTIYQKDRLISSAKMLLQQGWQVAKLIGIAKKAIAKGANNAGELLKIFELISDNDLPEFARNKKGIFTSDLVLQSLDMPKIQWVDTIKKTVVLAYKDTYFGQNKNRYELEQEIISLGGGTEEIKALVSKIKITLKEVDKKFKVRSSFLPDAEKAIYKWEKEEIKAWAEVFRALKDDDQCLDLTPNLPEILAVVKRAVEISFSYPPRDVQLMSVLALDYSNGGRIAQIDTGEGKTIILAITIILDGLQGHRPDIITSSEVLAIRDAEDLAPFFALFGFTVAHNIGGNKPGPQECYSKTIVYGTVGSFAGDILRDEFLGQRQRMGRGFDVVYVDEADSMFIDQSKHITMLTAGISGFEGLDAVFYQLWLRLLYIESRFMPSQHPGKICFESEGDGAGGKKLSLELDDTEAARAKFVKEQLKPAILDSFIQGGAAYLEDGARAEELARRKKLHESVLIEVSCPLPYSAEAFGINPARTAKQKQEQQQEEAAEVANKMLAKVQCPAVKGIFNDDRHKIPGHLVEYLKNNLDGWIDSALKAYHVMKKDVDYVVGESEHKKGMKIVAPADKGTGVISLNMHWGNGLHQFLEIKEGLTMSHDAPVTSFMSGISLLKRYGDNLYGMTGTLGKNGELDFLKAVYNVDFIFLPPFKKKQLTILLPEIHNNEQRQIDRITQDIFHETSKGKAVLVINETIEFVNKIEAALKKLGIKAKLYIRSDLAQEKIKSVHSGDIILATNLAGRGTDFDAFPIEYFGGLHVIMSYLPASERLDDQGFPRTARKGLSGTGKFILNAGILNSELLNNMVNQDDLMENLLEQREVDERFSLITDRHRNAFVMQLQDNLFADFQKFVISLKIAYSGETSADGQRYCGKDDRCNLNLQEAEQIIELWGIWLDSQQVFLNEEVPFTGNNSKGYDGYIAAIQQANQELENLQWERYLEFRQSVKNAWSVRHQDQQKWQDTIEQMNASGGMVKNMTELFAEDTIVFSQLPSLMQNSFYLMQVCRATGNSGYCDQAALLANLYRAPIMELKAKVTLDRKCGTKDEGQCKLTAINAINEAKVYLALDIDRLKNNQAIIEAYDSFIQITDENNTCALENPYSVEKDDDNCEDLAKKIGDKTYKNSDTYKKIKQQELDLMALEGSFTKIMGQIVNPANRGVKTKSATSFQQLVARLINDLQSTVADLEQKLQLIKDEAEQQADTTNAFKSPNQEKLEQELLDATKKLSKFTENEFDEHAAADLAIFSPFEAEHFKIKKKWLKTILIVAFGICIAWAAFALAPAFGGFMVMEIGSMIITGAFLQGLGVIVSGIMAVIRGQELGEFGRFFKGFVKGFAINVLASCVLLGLRAVADALNIIKIAAAAKTATDTAKTAAELAQIAKAAELALHTAAVIMVAAEVAFTALEYVLSREAQKQLEDNLDKFEASAGHKLQEMFSHNVNIHKIMLLAVMGHGDALQAVQDLVNESLGVSKLSGMFKTLGARLVKSAVPGLFSAKPEVGRVAGLGMNLAQAGVNYDRVTKSMDKIVEAIEKGVNNIGSTLPALGDQRAWLEVSFTRAYYHYLASASHIFTTWQVTALMAALQEAGFFSAEGKLLAPVSKDWGQTAPALGVKGELLQTEVLQTWAERFASITIDGKTLDQSFRLKAGKYGSTLVREIWDDTSQALGMDHSKSIALLADSASKAIAQKFMQLLKNGVVDPVNQIIAVLGTDQVKFSVAELIAQTFGIKIDTAAAEREQEEAKAAEAEKAKKEAEKAKQQADNKQAGNQKQDHSESASKEQAPGGKQKQKAKASGKTKPNVRNERGKPIPGFTGNTGAEKSGAGKPGGEDTSGDSAGNGHDGNAGAGKPGTEQPQSENKGFWAGVKDFFSFGSGGEQQDAGTGGQNNKRSEQQSFKPIYSPEKLRKALEKIEAETGQPH